LPKPAKLVVDDELKPGDWVKLADSETTGQVMEIVKDNVIIAIGDLRTVAKKKRVQKSLKRKCQRKSGKATAVHQPVM
jgi:DNA mismatch repair protein MutS2